MAHRTRRLLRRLLAGSLLLAGSAAPAQDAPPQAPAPAPAKPAPAAPADPLEAEVDGIRRLVTAGIWKSAKAAIEKFFAAHAGDRRVIAHLPGLESDLQKTLFRLSGPQPTPVQLLGRGATKFDPSSGRAEFRASFLASETGWNVMGETAVFDVLFDKEVSVEMSASTALETTVLLGFDSEAPGGFYMFTPGAWQGSRGTEMQANAYRVDPGASKPEHIIRGGLIFSSGSTESVRYALTPGNVIVEVRYTKDWNPRDRRNADSCPDTTYRRGFLAVRGHRGPPRVNLTIAGKVDRMFAARQMAEADARRLREWQKERWNRAASLPGWVLDLERAAGAWADNLPAGIPAEAREGAARIQRWAFEGTAGAAAPPVPPGLEGAGADWVRALVAFREGRHVEAGHFAGRVREAEPSFAPARALAGRALLGRGSEEAALGLLEESRRLDGSFAPAYDGLALAAFRNGDTERMRAVLSEAAAAGVSSRVTADLRQALLRVQRGPDWKKRFEIPSADFLVTGDASYAVCDEISKTLKEAFDIYGRQFRPRPRKARARVRVFSGFESYADYVSDLGANPAGTLGMYVPAIRELCVFLHEDRPELSNTLRHEAFHQYLHQFMDEVPIWFNEGYAEYFGFSRRKQGKALVGQVGEDQASLAKTLLPQFTPLRDLFVMEPAKFMAKPVVHYVQSWAVIHLLRAPPDPAMKDLLDRYFDTLLEGRSQTEAYEKILAPLVDPLEAALRAHVGALTGR